MSDKTRAISAIVIPLKVDVSGMGKGFKEAEKLEKEHQKKVSKLRDSVKGNLDKSLDKIGLGGLESKLASLKNVFKGLSTDGTRSLTALSVGVGAVALAATAAGAAFKLFSGGHIADIGKDAAGLGLTSEALSKLQAVAKGSGVEVKDLNDFLGSLKDTINDSIGNVKTSAQAFKELGTSAEELQKMTPEQQIATLNKGFAALPTNVDKSQVAMRAFGKDAYKVERLLTMNPADFKAKYADAPIVSEKDVDAVRKLQIALDKIGETLQKWGDYFTVKIAPTLEALLTKVSSLFSLKIPTVAAPVAPKVANQPAAPAPTVGPDPAKVAAAQAAQARVNDLQKRFDKEAQGLAMRPGHTVATPSTNGNVYRFKQSNQKDLDRHAQTGAELNAEKKALDRLTKEASTQAEGMALANRANKKLTDAINDLHEEYREQIQTSGMDDVHRRVNALKGISDADRKKLIQEGYQAREAGKTTALRDELQESTKLPAEKLAEDLNRINKMVALGPNAGGLTRQQGIRAAAQKTGESGIGAPPKLAGALQANSMEGRSYLLAQMGRSNDPAALAQKGFALTGMTNTLLGKLVDEVRAQRQTVYSL
jgi:hypothetical protein